MRCNTDYIQEPSGVRLMRLIETKMSEIIRQEASNETKMCLYGTGDYWTAFEHSAYFLKQLFPHLEAFVVNHPKHPFSVIGVSIPADLLRSYLCRHEVHHRRDDYLEILIPPFDLRDYGAWHAREVAEFL